MEKVLSASKAGFPCMRNVWYTVNGYEILTAKDVNLKKVLSRRIRYSHSRTLKERKIQ